MIVWEWFKRQDGKFNIWRKGTGPWILIHVVDNEFDARKFCDSRNTRSSEKNLDERLLVVGQ